MAANREGKHGGAQGPVPGGAGPGLPLGPGGFGQVESMFGAAAPERGASRMPFAMDPHETGDGTGAVWGTMTQRPAAHGGGREPWQGQEPAGVGTWPQTASQQLPGMNKELFEGWTPTPQDPNASPPTGGQRWSRDQLQEMDEFDALQISDEAVPHKTAEDGDSTWSAGKRPRQKQKLHVGGLSRGTNEADLRGYFSRFGEVFEVSIPFVETARAKKYFGFVKVSIDAAKQALSIEEHTINRDSVTVSQVGSVPGTKDSADLSSDPFYRTKLCKNFLDRGACPYEDRCWFAHGESQLRVSDMPQERKMADQAYRTKLCTHWEAGDCQYGDSCIFAHGEQGLRTFGEGDGNIPRRTGTAPRAASDNPAFRTQICTRWLEGSCQYGDRCNFAHGEEDLRPFGATLSSDATPFAPAAEAKTDPAFRTKLCTRWAQGGCQYGDRCMFAHGEDQLRPFGEGPEGGPAAGLVARGAESGDPAFRTKICTRWMQGSCQYGDRCNFAHGEDNLRTYGTPRGGDGQLWNPDGTPVLGQGGEFPAFGADVGAPVHAPSQTQTIDGNAVTVQFHNDDDGTFITSLKIAAGALSQAVSVRAHCLGQPRRMLPGSASGHGLAVVSNVVEINPNLLKFSGGAEILLPIEQLGFEPPPQGSIQILHLPFSDASLEWVQLETTVVNAGAIIGVSAPIQAFGDFVAVTLEGSPPPVQVPAAKPHPSSPSNRNLGGSPKITGSTVPGGVPHRAAPPLLALDDKLKTEAESNPEAFGRWLGCFGLEAFCQPLVTDGVSNLALLRSLEECDVDEIMLEHGMQRMQKRVFKREWSKLRGEALTATDTA